ncbi:MAG: HAMP domain-containing sensor histidine kinase [Clostridium sp.]|uniref:HAMP domain-containing sensor histidine kinase n=1 Tax=Clostridium sp. TaxID=1506 RepID=UPI00306A653C
MIKTIRGKIILGFIITTLLTLVSVNLIIWQVFEGNLKNYIKEDMDKAKSIAVADMENKYDFGVGDFGDDNNQIWKVLSGINNQYDMYISFDYDENRNIEFLGSLIDDIERGSIIKDSNKKSSLLYISKEVRNNNEDYFYATYAYPVYIDETYTGTLVFQKDYLYKYKENLMLVTKIISVQLILFLVMIFIAYILLKSAIKPLDKLSIAMVSLGEGDFKERLRVNGSDEISTLIYHFNSMQDKIEGQMNQLYLEKEKIKELEKTSREFMNYATHEMKTPLTAMLGYSELLQTGTLSKSEVTRAYERISTEGNRLKFMVQNMLVVAKGKEKITKIAEKLNITNMLRDFVTEYNIIFEKNNNHISIEGNDMVIYGVKEEVRMVIANLLDNGVKYSDDGKIYIKVCSDEKIVLIENKTRSMPDEIKDNLFKPFVKYNYGDNTKASSGLGLFICKELMEKNEGNISCEFQGDSIRFILEFRN